MSSLDQQVQGFVRQLAQAIAEELQSNRSDSLELLDIPQLATETGLSPDYLKAQCRKWEAGNPEGLKCTRKDAGVRNSTLLVGRDWFAEWRDRMAARNQELQAPVAPELAAKLARSRSERVSKKQATRKG